MLQGELVTKREILFSNGRGSLFTVKPDGTQLRKIPIHLNVRDHPLEPSETLVPRAICESRAAT